ncbi:MAG: PQQ-binding-like beta-propeller repeat protein [Planctomycetes bacterium]|nr:PQQ-binding-like beta-propeller repeat protein [Planctomycetota bacterium]
MNGFRSSQRRTNWQSWFHKGVAFLFLATGLFGAASFSLAADQPQWGQRWSRNMVSDEKGLPATFDPETGENIKWSVPLGTETYSSPIVARGCVFIGTNSRGRRDLPHPGEFGVLLCLDQRDGRLRWELIVPKIPGDALRDWPGAGHCSPPTIDGDRVYVVTNRAEVVCLDLDGLSDGNDGPFRDEARHQTPAGQQPTELRPTDADIIWLFDMWAEGCMYPHDSAHSSILIDGDYLYLNTGNGVDRTHRRIPAPDAPSLIVLDKRTGRLIAQDAERIGPRIFHCTWSSPALVDIDGRRLIVFCGGDGVCYAFRALPSGLKPGPVRTLERVWRFDFDPHAPKENVHSYIGNRLVSPSNIKSMPVVVGRRVYLTGGGDIWWGKRKAWLKCVDITGSGDVTRSGLVWSYELQYHCCSTPAVHDGLIFVADCGRMVHCLDAVTGKPYWTHRTGGPIWASTLVADGKVYVGTRRGDFWVFSAGRKKKVLSSVRLGSPITSTATAANGVLYVATFERLYAIARKEAKAAAR